MNKFLAILLALGALGAFGLSQRDSFDTWDRSPTGAAVGETRTIPITRGDRAAYIAMGVACMIGSLYFVARMRRGK